MMPYGNGMNHSAPAALRSPGDCYITEGWMIAHWIRVTSYAAPPNLLIWDPAACGVEGWAIGRALGLALGRPYLLSDMRPMGKGVSEASYPAPRPDHDGPILTATNPPFKDLSEWINAWRSTARHGDGLLFVTDSGALTTAEPRAWGMVERVQPLKRPAFALTVEDAQRFRDLKAADPNLRVPVPVASGTHKTGPTGEGMPSTGKAHCMGLWMEPVDWRARHDEISVDVTPADLRWGLDLMSWCKEE